MSGFVRSSSRLLQLGACSREMNGGSAAKAAAGGWPATARLERGRRGPVRLPLRERDGIGLLLLLTSRLLGDDCRALVFRFTHGSVQSISRQSMSRSRLSPGCPPHQVATLVDRPIITPRRQLVIRYYRYDGDRASRASNSLAMPRTDVARDPYRATVSPSSARTLRRLRPRVAPPPLARNPVERNALDF
jgi:hypothetical protein